MLGDTVFVGGGFDLLGGRALVRSLHPFMAAELKTFELAGALRTS